MHTLFDGSTLMRWETTYPPFVTRFGIKSADRTRVTELEGALDVFDAIEMAEQKLSSEGVVPIARHKR